MSKDMFQLVFWVSRLTAGVLFAWVLARFTVDLCTSQDAFTCIIHGLVTIFLSAPIGFLFGFILVDRIVKKFYKGKMQEAPSSQRSRYWGRVIGSTVGVFLGFGVFLLGWGKKVPLASSAVEWLFDTLNVLFVEKLSDILGEFGLGEFASFVPFIVLIGIFALGGLLVGDRIGKRIGHSRK